MGQYYNPRNLDNKEWLYSHDSGSGLKLMEHSWVGNEFVGRVMELLTKGGSWYKAPIVWAGDYYSDDGEIDYYSMCDDENKINPTNFLSEKEQEDSILVNHTKKQYVIVAKVSGDIDGWKVNPLPLLTALGNGRGGGDYGYESPDNDLVGSWATDIISVETEIPEGFVELIVNFLDGEEDNEENREKRAEQKRIEDNRFYLYKEKNWYNPLTVNYKANTYELKNIIFFKDGKEFMSTGRGWFENSEFPRAINVKLLLKRNVDLSLDTGFMVAVKSETLFGSSGRFVNLYLPLDKFNFKKIKTYTTKYNDSNVVYNVMKDEDLGIQVTRRVKEILKPERPLQNEISDIDKQIKALEKQKTKAEKKLTKLIN